MLHLQERAAESNESDSAVTNAVVRGACFDRVGKMMFDRNNPGAFWDMLLLFFALATGTH